jgi:hypothetical protein
MDRRVYNNTIQRLKTMKGRSRLEVKNELTESLLNLEFPKVSFLESHLLDTPYGHWEEYYIFVRLHKVEAPEYMKYLMFQIDKIITILTDNGILDSGIQEFECDDYTYNILIYAINNGEETEKCKETEYEELFGECY